MSDVAQTLPLGSAEEPEQNHAQAARGAKASRGEPVKWEVVAKAPGLLPAQVIAGRLQTAGIPVRAWQEGAGQALGLTVGLLGTGYVAVPEEYVAQAEALLADTVDDDAPDEDPADDE